MKLWEGVTSGEVSELLNQINSSISFDSKMFKEDIEGSLAHSKMLCKCGIISSEEFDKIEKGLKEILSDLISGKLKIDMDTEDIHTFIELKLTEKIGITGKKLHTARSRNDQVALDLRLYLAKEIKNIKKLLLNLIVTLKEKAEDNTETVMAGYTHLQRAQPINFAHHLSAYIEMFIRDIKRLDFTLLNTEISPLGCSALAGTSYPIDRNYSAKLLGFNGISKNSMDGVSDRDFVLMLASDISIIMAHLSRFSEEIILWSSWEYKYITLSDDFSTGSSIMPQKKNPDVAELIRGKTGRVYGDMMALFTLIKGLPLAYNKDLQEDKENIFDSVETVTVCLKVMSPMIKTMTINKERMKNFAKQGFINATDVADYLTVKGMAFRDAYKITGEIVKYCMKEDKTLESISLEEYKSFSDLFKEDIFDEIDITYCMKKRKSEGGAGNTEKYLEELNSRIKELG